MSDENRDDSRRPAVRPASVQRRFELYVDYAKTLRLWFVAYGIGAPVLFLSRKDIADQIVASGRGTLIVILFLAGATLQVLNAAINKWAAWYTYVDARDGSPPTALKHPTADKISDQFWLDLALDICSTVLFAWATLETLIILLT